MSTIFNLSLILLSGIFFAKLVAKIKLPNVTGYLIAGIIIGPYVLNLVPIESANGMSIISDVALGFIAYGIGSEFNINNIKKTGKTVILLTIFEALGAVVLVDLAMIFIFKQPLEFSIVLGAIAAATAPAATIMVIRQYGAKGKFTSTLLQVVAMDDAVGIILFGISSAIAKAITEGGGNLAIAIVKPFTEIVMTFIVGIIIGVIYCKLAKIMEGDGELLIFTTGFILLSVGIATKLNISALLTCMMFGATIANLFHNPTRFIGIIDKVTPPIYVCFFTLAGLQLDLAILKTVGLVGAGYIIFRVLGKMLGVFVAAKISKAEDNIRRYLGLALIPQAGVAIGLSLIAEQSMPGLGSQIRTIVLAGTVIYELIGPFVAKIALTKAGDIR